MLSRSEQRQRWISQLVIYLPVFPTERSNLKQVEEEKEDNQFIIESGNNIHTSMASITKEDGHLSNIYV